MWDTWSAPEGQTFPAGLVRQFDRTAQWAPDIEAGHWPDADMLPLGYLGPRPGWKEARMSRLTADESRTLMTLWSMARSPLVAGTNLTKIDPATEALYTNPEVIAVDQHSRENRELSRHGSLVVWKASPESGGGQYVAVFNLGDTTQEGNYSWKDLGLPEGTHAVAICGRVRNWVRLGRSRLCSRARIRPLPCSLIVYVIVIGNITTTCTSSLAQRMFFIANRRIIYRHHS